MKNEELVNLRGGYGAYYDYFICTLTTDEGTTVEVNGVANYSKSEAEAALINLYSWVVDADCTATAFKNQAAFLYI